MFTFLSALFVIVIVNGADMPTVSLGNAAVPGLKMPVVRLGTFGYAPYGGEPENWTPAVGYNASLLWWSVGARGWDGAFGYESKPGVAKAIIELTNNYTTTARSDIWITQKVGASSGCSMGYDAVMKQYNSLLKLFETSYFDLVLIHWPSCNGPVSTSPDPACQPQNKNSYDPGLCRQHTWKALEDMFTNGTAKAIGVSNFEAKHIEDIVKMNSLLPAVNQFEFHGYWHEFGLVAYCQTNNITVNSYAPLGAPDVEADGFHDWKYVLTQNPVAIQIGNKYKKSPAQVWLRWAWQQQIVLNPRTLNVDHMKENIAIFDFELTADDMQQLSTANSTAPKYPNDKVCPDPNTFA